MVAIEREPRVRIGSSIETLQATKINDENGFYLNSDHWKGCIIVRVAHSRKQNPAYFHGKYRTFSIQFRNAQWKTKWQAEDIFFGAVFDGPINPPFGSSIALKCARLIDPSLEADLYSHQPWILSPLLCAFNDLVVSNGKENCEIDEMYMSENNALLFGKNITNSQRRARLKSKAELSKCEIRPEFVFSGDFYGPILDLVKMTLNLGIHVNIEKYINEQPIRFLAKSKSTGTVFFVIEFSSYNPDLN
jgi:hypothetical protein